MLFISIQKNARATERGKYDKVRVRVKMERVVVCDSKSLSFYNRSNATFFIFNALIIKNLYSQSNGISRLLFARIKIEAIIIYSKALKSTFIVQILLTLLDNLYSINKVAFYLSNKSFYLYLNFIHIILIQSKLIAFIFSLTYICLYESLFTINQQLL